MAGWIDSASFRHPLSAVCDGRFGAGRFRVKKLHELVKQALEPATTLEALEARAEHPKQWHAACVGDLYRS